MSFMSAFSGWGQFTDMSLSQWLLEDNCTFHQIGSSLLIRTLASSCEGGRLFKSLVRLRERGKGNQGYSRRAESFHAEFSGAVADICHHERICLMLCEGNGF
ncbi:hypothetical protein SKAU_G00023970 [Synaphobranchus kaupii]|uniref:Uncharacterized protein n=1 Tax=Synaphobranchus kaupii TaxID=118154 RepID=A0A9Q1GCF9_SYNKA|nr:hypothetical protein SKAU_G00023970 [Synaphobranchus kaupii]